MAWGQNAVSNIFIHFSALFGFDGIVNDAKFSFGFRLGGGALVVCILRQEVLITTVP